MTTDTPPPPTVVVTGADLFFSEKIKAAASGLGATVVSARTPEKLRAVLAAGPVAVVVVDLDRTDAAALRDVVVSREAGSARRVVGFYSHVNADAAHAAAEAGVDEAVPRSAFFGNLARLLAADAPAGG